VSYTDESYSQITDERTINRKPLHFPNKSGQGSDPWW
jgi:hypothetical protein